MDRTFHFVILRLAHVAARYATVSSSRELPPRTPRMPRTPRTTIRTRRQRSITLEGSSPSLLSVAPSEVRSEDTWWATRVQSSDEDALDIYSRPSFSFSMRQQAHRVKRIPQKSVASASEKTWVSPQSIVLRNVIVDPSLEKTECSPRKCPGTHL